MPGPLSTVFTVEMFTMRPPSLSRLAASRIRMNGLRTLATIVSSKSSSLVSAIMPVVPTAALLTRMSSGPAAASACSKELTSGIRFPEVSRHGMRAAASGDDSRYYLGGSILVDRVTQHDLRAVGG